jgi:hypothetical protein
MPSGSTRVQWEERPDRQYEPAAAVERAVQPRLQDRVPARVRDGDPRDERELRLDRRHEQERGEQGARQHGARA